MKPVIVKEYLTQALFVLLKEKPYSRITVNELVQKAGVCRSSFYRNYLTMDQIIDEYLRTLFRNPPMLDPNNLKDGICKCFSSLLSEKETLIVLAKQNLLLKLPGYIYESTMEQIVDFGVLNNRYQPHFFAGAASATIIAWINYGMEESAEVMADLFIQSLGGYMEFH